MGRMKVDRFLRLGGLVVIAAALAACSYGGGSSGSASTSSAGGGSADPPITARLAWSEASGPVAAYRVYESRNGGGYTESANVVEAAVTVSGEPGDTLQIQVAALDVMGNEGPRSESSALLAFDENGVSLAPPAAAATAEGSDAGSVSALSASPSDALVVSDAPPANADDGATTTAASTSSGGAEGEASPSVRLDLDGDGTTDLLWASLDGSLLRITSSEGVVVAIFDRPAAEWELVAIADLDGDGLSDLLWAQESGALALSRMGVSLDTQPALDFQDVGGLGARDWIRASGDYDGDGSAELLVQDADSGALSIWRLAAGAAPAVTELGFAPAAGQEVAGSRDYDGDGDDDLLLQGVDGALAVWRLAAGALQTVVPLGVEAGGDVLASGDFDGDRFVDVARLDAAGAIQLVLLGAGLDAPVTVAGDAAETGLEAVGVGDYDGDGRSDLLWLDASGELVVWYLDPGVGIESMTLPMDAGWSLIPDWR